MEGYYVVKKTSTGWIVASQVDHSTKFIPIDDLIKMGYVAMGKRRSVTNITSETLTVPLGK